jgi:hypothetical protein
VPEGPVPEASLRKPRGGHATLPGDAIGLLVIAPRPQPPLQTDDGDLVMPANAVEQVDQLARRAT